MIIFNDMCIDTAKVVIVKTFIGSRTELMGYGKSLREIGLDGKEVMYVSLYDKKPSSISVGDMREKYKELQDFLRLTRVNVVVDDTEFRENKNGKFKQVKGLVFDKIFGKNVGLWSERGIFVKEGVKWLCGFRGESLGRECQDREVLDSEFVVDEKLANIITITDGEEAVKVIKELYANNDEIFVDTETNDLNYDKATSKLLTLQLTGGNDKYTSYVFFIEHPKVTTTNNMKLRMKQGMKYILESNKKIFIHNANFDLLWLKFCLVPDLDFYKINIYDTMIIYGFLKNSIEDFSVGLKESSFIEGVSADWESILDTLKTEYCQTHKLKKEDFSYDMFPVDELITYAGMDTIVLAHYWDMLQRINTEHIVYPKVDIIKDTWENSWQSVMQSVHYQINTGLPFHLPTAYKQLEVLKAEVNELYDVVLNDEATKVAESIINANNFKKALKLYDKKCEEASAKGKEFKGKKPNLDDGKYGQISFNETFNPASSAHKQALIIEALSLPIYETTDSGGVKLGTEEMSRYVKEYPDIKVLQCFDRISKINKEIGTYYEPFIDIALNSVDGRIRSSFVPLNKSTRMRCGSPNLLNLPKTDFKKCIREDDDNLILQFDYSALENILALNGHKDEVRLSQYNSGIQDAHAVNAIIRGKALGMEAYDNLSVTSPEDVLFVKENYPSDRNSSKSITFALQYLGSYKSIQFGLNISEESAKDIYNTYWETFKGERKFFLERVNEMQENGYLKLIGGATILTPNITDDLDDKLNMNGIRTGYNAIFQSGAYITLSSMDKFQRRMYQEKLPVKTFLSVYDSAVFSAPKDLAIYTREALLTEMVKPYMDNQTVMLKADAEIGISYKAETAFEGNETNLLEILSNY